MAKGARGRGAHHARVRRVMTRLLTDFAAQIDQRRVEALARIDRVPIAALIWGPAPSAGTPVADARVRLRDELAARGHHARYSEELVDTALPYSVFAQQLAQAEAFDIVFSIPDSPGSIAEIHDFARIPELSYKVVAFLNEAWNTGYANQSLMQLESTATCRIQTYKAPQLPGCVLDTALSQIRRLQEFYYANGRRF